MRTSTRELVRQWFVVAFALLFQVGVTVSALETQAAGRGTQGQSSILKGPYLAQKWAGPGVELFAPHIVSTGLLESSIAFAPDGRACYFSVTLPPALSVIVEMKQENGIWSAPEVAPFSHGLDDGNPAISPDGRHFYFTSTRSLDGGPKPSSRPYPWVMERTGSSWGAPRPLNIPIGDKQYIMNILPVRSGDLYLTLREGQKETICRSQFQDGNYLAPEPLAAEINRVQLQLAGYVAPDESYLLFSAFDGVESQGGSDLYVSFRHADGSWETAVNLGPGVNTPDNEFTPYVSPDGEFLFFSRFNQRPVPGADPKTPLTYKAMKDHFAGPQNGLRDIFWIETAGVPPMRFRSR
jgi:hypothetical protein